VVAASRWEDHVRQDPDSPGMTALTSPVRREGCCEVNASRLTLVRGVHTAVYVVMSASALLLLYAGVTGESGPWLSVALTLLSIQTVVFIGNGLTCPLTELAVRYGARTGHVFETFLLERFTRYTFRFFASATVAGAALLVLRGLGLLG